MKLKKQPWEYLIDAMNSKKWEKCMFGYVIHLPNSTIRIYVKKKLKQKARKQ